MLIIIDTKNLRFVSLKISYLELKINQIKIWISIIQKYCCCSVAQTCLTLCNPMDCSILGFPIPYHLLKFAQIRVCCICDVIQPSYPLMPSALNLSQNQGLFQWVIRWPKYWSFSFSISPSNEYSGLISYKIDRLDLPAIQGTLKSLLQHHS